MSRNNQVILSSRNVAEIKQLASSARSLFGVNQSVPVGNDIRMVLEKNDIWLCEYPFSESGDTHTYGNIVMFKTGEKTITFIGLNTASYYDEQIFALAHEIYHYTTKTGNAYSSEPDEEDKETEKKADRFAAEFLLPADVLGNMIAMTFDSTCLDDVPEGRLLRFVARIQCDWWLPYQSIVNRLFEEGYISEKKYVSLYEIDCRSNDSLYCKILNSTDSKISELLNTKTMTIGVSATIIDCVISNFEDGFIDEDEFIKILGLFGKKPEDYGIDVIVELDEDLLKMTEREDN